MLGLRTCASGSPVACPQLSTEFRSAAMRNSFFKPGGLFTDFEEAMKRTECAECRSGSCITHAVCRRISDQVVGAQYPSLLSSSARMQSKLTNSICPCSHRALCQAKFSRCSCGPCAFRHICGEYGSNVSQCRQPVCGSWHARRHPHPRKVAMIWVTALSSQKSCDKLCELCTSRSDSLCNWPGSGRCHVASVSLCADNQHGKRSGALQHDGLL